MPPTSPAKPHGALRKQPQQARAARTIDAILEATARILAEEGEAAFTTNRVAERAGCSVGTLYQYFPHKAAILQAVMACERERAAHLLRERLERALAEGHDPRTAVRDSVRLLMAAFGAGADPARRTLMRLAWQADGHAGLAEALRAAGERNTALLARLSGGAQPLPHPVAMFAATRAVMGVIRSAALENAHWIGTRELEDVLVQLAWGLLAPPGDRPAAD